MPGDEGAVDVFAQKSRRLLVLFGGARRIGAGASQRLVLQPVASGVGVERAVDVATHVEDAAEGEQQSDAGVFIDLRRLHEPSERLALLHRNAGWRQDGQAREGVRPMGAIVGQAAILGGRLVETTQRRQRDRQVQARRGGGRIGLDRRAVRGRRPGPLSETLARIAEIVVRRGKAWIDPHHALQSSHRLGQPAETQVDDGQGIGGAHVAGRRRLDQAIAPLRLGQPPGGIVGGRRIQLGGEMGRIRDLGVCARACAQDSPRMPRPSGECVGRRRQSDG